MDLREVCFGCFAEREAGSICRCGWNEHAKSEVAEALPVGTQLHDGRYWVGRPLGRGGFSITYLAWDVSLQRRRALKEYFPEGLVTRTGVEGRISIAPGQLEPYEQGMHRYLAEARALARFEGHPCIVQPLDFFEENGTAYLVMEYLEGETLRAYVTRHGGRIPYGHALFFLLPILRALGAVHAAGLLHRDVSPDNVFLTAEGRSRLLDFGASRERTPLEAGATTVIVRDHYAPPEQYTARGRQGEWTDIYAFAATLYFALVGTPPPPALERVLNDGLPALGNRALGIPLAVQDLLVCALSVQPELRPQRVEDLLVALEDGQRASESARAPRWTRRAWPLVATVLLAAAAAFLRFAAPSIARSLDDEFPVALAPGAELGQEEGDVEDLEAEISNGSAQTRGEKPPTPASRRKPERSSKPAPGPAAPVSR